VSDVRYAANGDVHLAYRVMGDGPVDLMFVPLWFSNIDLLDQHPTVASGLEGLSSFSRLIVWDRRGAGLSDRMAGPATLEEGMDDLIAVLDDAGIERVALLGFNEGGTLSALTAATHPERVSALILYASFATTTWQPDYPWGQDPKERAEQIEWLTANWGSRETSQIMFPTGDERLWQWGMRWQRSAVTRDALPRFYDMLSRTDVRHVLPSIRVPTLVLHRAGDQSVPVENGRYLAEHIPDAKYVELDGVDHLPFLGDASSIDAEIEEFLTGTRRHRESDRVLATILFIDICDSTSRAADVGDERWRRLLDSYDAIVAEELQRFQGKLIKNTGDGTLATFDGPARAIRCALRMQHRLALLGLPIRSGLHTGEVDVRGDDIGGMAVHIGARVAALAGAGELLVSAAVPPLVAGSGIGFESRGTHPLKGVEGEWQLYAVSH